jgi:hypothetical protein
MTSAVVRMPGSLDVGVADAVAKLLGGFGDAPQLKGVISVRREIVVMHAQGLGILECPAQSQRPTKMIPPFADLQGDIRRF